MTDDKDCPKCSRVEVCLDKGIDIMHSVEMDRRTTQPHFYLTDGMGFALLWTEDNKPVLYRCPECGYVEMYIGEPK